MNKQDRAVVSCSECGSPFGIQESSLKRLRKAGKEPRCRSCISVATTSRNGGLFKRKVEAKA